VAEAVSIHEEEALGRAYDARLMRRLLAYLRPYRWRVVLAVLLLLTGALVELVGPYLTKVALDTAIPEADTTLLALLASAFFGALLLAFALEAAQTLVTTWLGQRVMFDLREEIFAHLQQLGLPYYDRNPVGRLMTRVTSDVEALNELFSSGVVAVFGDLFTLFFILGALFLLDAQLALVAMAVMPFIFAVAIVFRRRIREAYRDIRIRLARINAFLQERISGIAVIQLFGQEARTADRFREVNDDYLAAHLRSITYYALFFPVIELLTAVSFALIITYGGAGVIAGTVSVGVIAAFLQYSRRFFRPIQDLSEKYNMLQGAMAASERIFQLLDTPAGSAPPRWVRDTAQDHEPQRALPTRSGVEPGREPGGEPAAAGPAVPLPSGAIEFRNVWFAYQTRDGRTSGDVDAGERADWEWVLCDVSFRARAGERIAVVGHTGAGKTSLISLLMRFYEPQRGEILFDGVPIRDIPVDVLREHIGLVLQDVFLFSRDVAYNIRLGRADIDDAAIHAAAREVGADDVVLRLPRAWAEPIGERGASLSVGERQLLSFARALAFDPLVLVLDEATSSVDSALEQRIEIALERLMTGRTSIVIAHRLSTVRNADRILVLHHGELREEGTHGELLRKGGLYARLHELQFVGAGSGTAGGATAGGATAGGAAAGEGGRGRGW
jgi:ATP-binding cassette, subfamily B, multidrug efflux pump